MIKEPKVLISIDWLSLFCTGQIPSSVKYRFVETGDSSRQFSKIYKVFRKNKLFAVVQAYPRSKVLKPDALIVKFENYLLYETDAQVIIPDFLEDLGWQVNNISRLDICGDLQSFEKGIEITQFYDRLMAHKYVFNNKCDCHCYFTSDLRNTYHGLTIGKRSSPVFTILYNKTKEMKDVKQKAHIVELWESYGFDPEKDVYRIEFRLNSDCTSKIVGLGTFDQKMKYNDIFNYDFLKRIWFSFLLEKLNIKRNDGTMNKTRMEPVVLLTPTCLEVQKLKQVKAKDAGRMERILINKLEEIRQESFDMEVDELNAFVDVMNYILNTRHLKDYFFEKHPSSIFKKY